MINKIYWDIETEPLPIDHLEKLMPEFPAPGNIKDPAKIAAAIAEKKEAWLDGAALKAITGRIVAISLAFDDGEPEMWKGDGKWVGEEEALIEHAMEVLVDVISQNALAYAWNGHGFDLPFLCQRAAVYGIPAFKQLMVNVRGRYYWNEALIDPKLVWSNYSPDHTGTSLKSVGLALGVGEKTGSGKDFAELLKTNPAEAEKYAKLDITLLRGIVQRMGI